MLHVLEGAERLLDYRVGGLAPELRDERDPARVMLVGGVVEASGPGRSESVHGSWLGKAGGGKAERQRLPARGDQTP